MKRLFFIGAVLVFALNANTQNTVAKFKYEDAEKAYYENKFEDCIKLLTETEALLGQTAPNILHLRILAEHKLLEQNPMHSYTIIENIRNHCDTYLQDYDIAGLEEKYRDVYEIQNTLGRYPSNKSAFDEKIAAVEASKIKNSLEAKKIIERYLEAIGGKDKVANVKTMFRSGEVFGEPFPLLIEDKKMAPNKFTSSRYFKNRKKKGDLIYTDVFNGETGHKRNKTSKTPLTETEILTFKEHAIFPELNYLALPYKLHIVDTLNLASGKAYKLKIESPLGKVLFRFYNVLDNLLYKIEVKNEEPNTQGEIILSDYKDVNGILMPFTIQSGSSALGTVTSISGDQEALEKLQNKQVMAIAIMGKNQMSSIKDMNTTNVPKKTITVWSEIKINEEVTESDFKLD
ncbi:hypothetical protein OE09_0728 [Flavobacteriaceae bacterium MAR_2010_72]|nr:hypothetical protein OE09_0728 [Flavobacteriaceae bacterium MAR_2010_72]TVZ57630.1 hypothetical protein NA63_0115 [Flavobacteriaceae bacterium MAR_2010_105]